MQKELKKSLMDYGFTENQTEIYLVLLKKLESSVFEIAKETDIPRATTYITLEKMKALGLVTSLRKNKILYYTPENPNRLQILLEEKSKILNSILPNLNALIDTDKEKPNIKMYTGASGVKIVLEEMLSVMKREGISELFAVSQSNIIDLLPKYFPGWIKKRQDLGIRTKLLLPEDEKDMKTFESNPLREVRYIPSEFQFGTTIEIFGKRMGIFNLKDDEIYSIIIESGPVVGTFTQFFKFMWRNTK